MPRSSLIVCLLGYDSNTCGLPDDHCDNYRFCQLTAAAWSLPFYYEDGALVVSFARASVRNCWVQCVTDGTLSGGLSSDYYSSNFGDELKLIWKEFGWFPAVTNPSYPFHLAPDYDLIPF